MVVKTYRGLLADGGQDRIRLQTIKGKVGYRIVKFQVMPNNPAAQDPEAIIQITKNSITTPSELINFTDSDLLAAAYYSGGDTTTKPQDSVIIFDNEIFNQDIYISLKDDSDNESMNYYIELEVIPLDDAGAEYTTLKDMRQT